MSRESAGIEVMLGEDGKRLVLTRHNKAKFMQRVLAHLTGENGVHIFLQDDREKEVAAAKLELAKASTDEERTAAEAKLAAAEALAPGPSRANVLAYIAFSRSSITNVQLDALHGPTIQIMGQKVINWLKNHMDQEMRRQHEVAEEPWTLWKEIGAHGGNERKRHVELLRAGNALWKGDRVKFASEAMRNQREVTLHTTGKLGVVDVKLFVFPMLAKIPAGLYMAQQKAILEGVFEKSWNWSQVVEELTSGPQETANVSTATGQGQGQQRVNAVTASTTPGQGQAGQPPGGPGATGTGTPRRFCWNFQRGSCARTDCRFLHEMDDRVCYQCNQAGHVRRNCPNQQTPPPAVP